MPFSCRLPPVISFMKVAYSASHSSRRSLPSSLRGQSELICVVSPHHSHFTSAGFQAAPVRSGH